MLILYYKIISYYIISNICFLKIFLGILCPEILIKMPVMTAFFEGSFAFIEKEKTHFHFLVFK